MKNQLLIAILCHICTSSVAQKPTGFLLASGGAAIPISEFSSTDPKSETSSFAKTGYNVGLSFAMPIARSNFGFSIQGIYYNNALDGAPVAQDLNIEDPTHLYMAGAIDNYETFSGMAGLFVTIPAKKISFDIQALAGIAYCTFPGVMIIGTGKETIKFSISPESNISFSYGLNGGIKFAIVKRLCLRLVGSYFSTNPEYSARQGIQIGYKPTTFKNVLVQQPTSIIGINLGVGLSI